jgi:hypothetical protein
MDWVYLGGVMALAALTVLAAAAMERTATKEAER